jgi:hypothetical protein
LIAGLQYLSKLFAEVVEITLWSQRISSQIIKVFGGFHKWEYPQMDGL